MRLIDEKGFVHIFKWKINIIDLFVLIFTLSFVPGLYYGWKILNGPVKPKTTIEIPPNECEEFKIKIRDYELLLNNLTTQKDNLIKQIDTLVNQRDRLIKQHRRLKKWFQ